MFSIFLGSNFDKTWSYHIWEAWTAHEAVNSDSVDTRSLSPSLSGSNIARHERDRKSLVRNCKTAECAIKKSIYCFHCCCFRRGGSERYCEELSIELRTMSSTKVRRILGTFSENVFQVFFFSCHHPIDFLLRFSFSILLPSLFLTHTHKGTPHNNTKFFFFLSQISSSSPHFSINKKRTSELREKINFRGRFFRLISFIRYLSFIVVRDFHSPLHCPSTGHFQHILFILVVHFFRNTNLSFRFVHTINWRRKLHKIQERERRKRTEEEEFIIGLSRERIHKKMNQKKYRRISSFSPSPLENRSSCALTFFFLMKFIHTTTAQDFIQHTVWERESKWLAMALCMMMMIDSGFLSPLDQRLKKAVVRINSNQLPISEHHRDTSVTKIVAWMRVDY